MLKDSSKDYEKRLVAINLILKYIEVKKENILPIFLQHEQDLTSTLAVLHTASEKLDRNQFSLLVSDLPVDKSVLDVLSSPGN